MRIASVLLVLLFSLGFTACQQDCPGACPAAPPPHVVVMTESSTVTAGVQATLTGSETLNLQCEKASGTTTCSWPVASPVITGTYSLQVSAPGEQTTTIQVEVATHGQVCCGSYDAISPSAVTLSPSDGGSD
jgi:hypothetical protein